MHEVEISIQMAEIVTAPVTLPSIASHTTNHSTSNARMIQLRLHIPPKRVIHTDTLAPLASSIPSCVSTPCAPCYISINPVTLTYPESYEFIGIQNETYTFNVTPVATTFPNGSVSTIYETEKRNLSTNVFGIDYLGTRLQEAYTWIVPGNSATNLTLYTSQTQFMFPRNDTNIPGLIRPRTSSTTPCSLA
jgi:hypothetical protein